MEAALAAVDAPVGADLTALAVAPVDLRVPACPRTKINEQVIRAKIALLIVTDYKNVIN